MALWAMLWYRFAMIENGIRQRALECLRRGRRLAVGVALCITVLLVFGAQIACQMTFTSLGYAKASIAVAVTRKFVLLIPLIYLMPVLFPADKTMAVYMAEPVADALAVTFTVILFSFQFRKALRQIGVPKEQAK